MWLGADGEPLGMLIDGRPYRIRYSPRLSVPGHFAMIQLCRRLQPGE
jgi:hypothetical protein